MASALLMAACTNDPTRNGTQEQPQDPDGGDVDSASSSVSAFLFQAPTPDFGPLAPLTGGDYLPSLLMFDSLLGLDDQNNVIPRMAEDHQISDDATTFTFTLREGLTWSDGEPVTADDLVFTYNRVANPAVGASVAANFRTVRGVAAMAAGSADSADGFAAPDDRTFVITSESPDVGLLSLLSRVLVLPEHVLGDVPVEQLAAHEYFRTPNPTAGPYEFVDYRIDQYVELLARPDHYLEPKTERIFLKPMTSDVATAQLGTGEIDLVQVSAADLPALEDMDNVEIASVQSPAFERLSINTEQERFADKRVRQAMLHAIDRQGLVDQALAGHGRVVNSVFFGEAVDEGVEQYPYDPDRAKELLAEVGWDADEPVRLWFVPGNRDRDTTATVVANNLQAVGFNVQIEQKQPAQNLEALKTPPGEDAYDLILHGGSNDGDPASAKPLVACDARQPDGPNNSRFCSPELDDVMATANAVTDDAERLELYREASLIENDQVSTIWLYSSDMLWAHSDRLDGFKPGGDASRTAFWNVHEWVAAE